MDIANVLKVNDWDFKRFTMLILVIQFSFIGSLLINIIGINIPFLRLVIGLIYLLFVPGALILRILKIHNITTIENVLYLIGLSLVTLMSIGFLINLVYPLLGISDPLNLFYLTITISLVVLGLLIISYMRDKDFSEKKSITLNYKTIKLSLSMFLLPLLAIIGTYLVNYYQNNIILMILIFIASISVILVAFDKIPKKMYPLLLFVVSLSLLYHLSLISQYIIGYDIHLEYYLSNLVDTNLIWNSQIPEIVNSMLSIVLLAPIISKICGISLVWVFKLVYPLIFSFVPLGLFIIYKKQTNDKIAFISVFFFIALFRFFYPMPRQNIAEFFLILIILLIIDKKMNLTTRSLLLLTFGFAMVVSHYALSYIFITAAISVWIMLFMIDRLRVKFGNKSIKKMEYNTYLSVGFVITILVFALSWYMYMASATTFNVFVDVLMKMGSTLYGDTFDLGNVQGIGLVTSQLTPLHNIAKYIHLFSQFLISIGLISVLINYIKFKFLREFKGFSIMSFIILVLSLSLPYFASSLNTDRLYHISLIFLAPFFVIGALTIFKWISKRLKKEIGKSTVFKLLSIFLMVFLLFNTGFIYEISNDHPTSIALSQQSINKFGDINDKAEFYAVVIPQQDIFGSKWFEKYRSPDYRIFTDTEGTTLKNGILVSSGIPYSELSSYNIDVSHLSRESYFYMRYFNLKYNMIEISGSSIQIPDNLVQQLRNSVYDNGGNSIQLS